MQDKLLFSPQLKINQDQQVNYRSTKYPFALVTKHWVRNVTLVRPFVTKFTLLMMMGSIQIAVAG